MYSIVYIVFIVIYTWYCRRIQGEFFNFLDAAICHGTHTHTWCSSGWLFVDCSGCAFPRCLSMLPWQLLREWGVIFFRNKRKGHIFYYIILHIGLWEDSAIESNHTTARVFAIPAMKSIQPMYDRNDASESQDSQRRKPCLSEQRAYDSFGFVSSRATFVWTSSFTCKVLIERLETLASMQGFNSSKNARCWNFFNHEHRKW